MGWENYHMHNFQVDESKFIEMEDDDNISVDSMWASFRKEDKRVRA